MSADEMGVLVAETMGYEWRQFTAKDGSHTFIQFIAPPKSNWPKRMRGKKVERPANYAEYAGDVPPLTLDWMHDVEESIRISGQWVEYVNKLFRICGSWESAVFASKEQRAEAYLTMKKNWKP